MSSQLNIKKIAGLTSGVGSHTLTLETGGADRVTVSNTAVTVTGNIVPGTANTYTLGTSSVSFQSAYFGSGIYLNGDTAAANLLDDYEEGTWTPVLASATTTTYTSQIGTYCKIGQLVFLYFDITINSVGDGSASTLAGLPFTPINNDALSVSYFASLAVSPYSLQFQMGVTGALAVGVTTAGATITNGMNIFGNSARVIASGCYRTTA